MVKRFALSVSLLSIALALGGWALFVGSTAAAVSLGIPAFVLFLSSVGAFAWAWCHKSSEPEDRGSEPNVLRVAAEFLETAIDRFSYAQASKPATGGVVAAVNRLRTFNDYLRLKRRLLIEANTMPTDKGDLVLEFIRQMVVIGTGQVETRDVNEVRGIARAAILKLRGGLGSGGVLSR